MEKTIVHRPHRDHEGIDEISIKVVPRFKTSGLSGDEWRVSTQIHFKRKGKVVFERGFHTIEDTVRFLPWLFHVEMVQSPDLPPIYGNSQTECAQPSCAKKAVNLYRLKKLFSREGDELVKEDDFEYRRAFCEDHSHRGDCSREDSDNNYELISGPGLKRLKPDDISPSQFGGVIGEV